MQTKISSCFIGLVLCSVAKARPQTFNNYPFRPTFSDLDQYNYYTTPMTYLQNGLRSWPNIIDQAVSPLYNLNQGSNGYLGNNVYSNTGTGTGYNPSGYLSNTNTYTNTGAGTGYNSNGYLTNSNGYSNTGGGTGYNPGGYLANSNGYSNSGIGYTTLPPYYSNSNPFGIYNGKK